MHTLRFLIATIVLAFAFAADVHADAATTPKVIRDVDRFLDYQREVRADIRKGSKYKHVDESSKRELFDAQDTLFELLEGKASTDELTDAQRIEVFNAQTKVAAVLNDAELDRPICKREKRLGSNRTQTNCTTKRELDRQREHSRQVLRDPKVCSRSVGEVCG